MDHNIKIKQAYLIHILEGRKFFEVRKNDRDYQVGDTIYFLPLEDGNYDAYSMRSPLPAFSIEYVHSGLGMEPKWVVLGIREIPTLNVDDLVGARGE